MSGDPTETIRQLLQSALEESDDSDVHYKIRTALQLLDFQEDQINRLTEAAAADPDLEKRLRDMGYL
jgi:hypothetical protein